MELRQQTEILVVVVVVLVVRLPVETVELPQQVSAVLAAEEMAESVEITAETEMVRPD
jgi:hypothetical protein